MQVPTVTEVVAGANLDLLNAASLAQQTEIVAVAESLFLRITGLTWDTVLVADEPLVRRAVRGLAELTAYQDSPEYTETLSDFDLISAFSAGPYSETRRSPEDAMKARLIVAWPWLSNLLWSLLTPDQYDYWIEFFMNGMVPAWGTQEVDWNSDFISTDYLWGA